MQHLNTYAEIKARNKGKINLKAFLFLIFVGISAIIALGVLFYNQPTFLIKLLFIVGAPLAVIMLTSVYVYSVIGGVSYKNELILELYNSKIFDHCRNQLMLGWENKKGLELNSMILYFIGKRYVISIEESSETDGNDNTFHYIKLSAVVDDLVQNDYRFLQYKNYCKKILKDQWGKASIEEFYAYITNIEETLIRGNIEILTLEQIRRKGTIIFL